MNYFLLFFFFSYCSYSQIFKEEEQKINIDSLLKTKEYEGIEIEKHIVKKGERMKNIYLKYKITPGEIYRLNPEAKDSLIVGSTLLIPLQKKVVYREWINPKWAKQNEANIKKQQFKKDSINIENRTKSAKLALEKESIEKNKKTKKGISKNEKTIVKNDVKDIKPKKDTLKTIVKTEKPKEIENKIISKIEVKDSIKSADIASEDLIDENGKKKKKKKKKKEVIYGSPDDHDVILDAKNKENYVLHEIEEGESLTMIAKKYNVPDYALLEFNKKVDFNKVTPGNLMKVPDIKKENVQSFIFDLISAYRSLNIKYDKEICKRKFTYKEEEDEE